MWFFKLRVFLCGQFFCTFLQQLWQSSVVWCQSPGYHRHRPEQWVEKVMFCGPAWCVVPENSTQPFASTVLISEMGGEGPQCMWKQKHQNAWFGEKRPLKGMGELVEYSVFSWGAATGVGPSPLLLLYFQDLNNMPSPRGQGGLNY